VRTKHGQPVMRHRLDAMLATLLAEKSGGKK
jgi:hypothetical protein